MGKIIITEEQLRLLNGTNERLLNSLHEEYLHEFMKKDPNEGKSLIKRVGEQFGIDLSFMFTYGAGITALVGPTSELIAGEFPNLNEIQIVALTIAAVGVIVFGNKEGIKKLVKTLKEEGLGKALSKVLSFVSSFESLAENVLGTAGMSVRGLSKIMGFAFIVPVISTLSEIMLNMGGSIDQVEDIVTRMLAYLATITVGETFATVLEKLKSKFKTNSKLEEEFLREHFIGGTSKRNRKFPDEMFEKFKKMFNKIKITKKGGWGNTGRIWLIWISPMGKIARIDLSTSASLSDIPFEEFGEYTLKDFHDFVDSKGKGWEIEVEGKFK